VLFEQLVEGAVIRTTTAQNTGIGPTGSKRRGAAPAPLHLDRYGAVNRSTTNRVDLDVG
jgi:hypothetical protein